MKIKIISIWLVCVLFVSAFGGTAFASNEISEMNAQDESLEDFMRSFYAGERDAYVVCDKKGEDITEIFFRETYLLYAESDFEKLQEFIVENVSSISKTTVDEVLVEAAATTKTVNTSSVIRMYTSCPEIPKYKNLEVRCTLSGSYTYDTSRNIILSGTKPVVEALDYISWPQTLVISPATTSTGRTIASDGKSINFWVDVDFNIYFTEYVGKFDFTPCHGSFNRVMNFSPETR